MFNFVFIMLILPISLLSIEIDNQTTFYELLSHSQIYKDYNRSENIKTIKNRDFRANTKKNLGFGYSPDFDIWIRFTLSNKTNHTIKKILEYSNPLTSYIDFFEENRLKKRDGLLNLSQNRHSINPIFQIKLNPFETKTFYIKISSKITTLIIKLNLWNSKDFYHKEFKHQIILALFFGAMGIIIIYNIIIFLATKELSYLYYVLFFMGTAFHHLMYKGVASLYLFSPETMQFLINYSSTIVAIPTIFLALFTQQILRLKQYPRLNRILFYLLGFYVVIIIIIHTMGLYHYRSKFFIVILLFLFFVSCYALFKKNRQARFIIVGWIVFVSSGIFMYLSSAGIYDIFVDYPYYTELSLVLEMTIFSLALASKIKMLNKEKLLSQKRALLLRELNHRVKNSMQTILSFLILQKDKIKDKKTEEILTNIENRIMATTHLYSLLHTKENIIVADMQKYFYLITNNIQKSFKQNTIKINIYSSIIMKSELAIHCGLIVNEAVTNAFKYAFGNGGGEIKIYLWDNSKNYFLTIKDNGIGFDKNSKSGLGLDIIETLAILQLDGKLNIKTDNGVEINIIWEKDEK